MPVGINIVRTFSRLRGTEQTSKDALNASYQPKKIPGRNYIMRLTSIAAAISRWLWPAFR